MIISLLFAGIIIIYYNFNPFILFSLNFHPKMKAADPNIFSILNPNKKRNLLNHLSPSPNPSIPSSERLKSHEQLKKEISFSTFERNKRGGRDRAVQSPVTIIHITRFSADQRRSLVRLFWLLNVIANAAMKIRPAEK